MAEITTREQLRQACAALCWECDEGRAENPRVVRMKGQSVEEGWHHVEGDPEDGEWHGPTGRCEASSFRDQVDPEGEIERSPGTWALCPCDCHTLGEGVWTLDGDCTGCDDRDAFDVVEVISDILPVQIPGRCPVGAAIHLAAERDGLRCQVEDQQVEIRRLWAKLEEAAALYNARTLRCAFCDEAYPPGTPPSQHVALTEHIKVCPSHPMRALERENDALRARIPEAT